VSVNTEQAGITKRASVVKKHITKKYSKSEVGQRVKPKRQRRVIPENKTDLYISDEPTPNDVVSGRGGAANHHEGNKPYWRLILKHRNEYKYCGHDNFKKNDIAMKVIKSVREKHGRFLQREASNGRWFRIPEKVIMDKVKQALRDEYVPLFMKEETDNDQVHHSSAPPKQSDASKKQLASPKTSPVPAEPVRVQSQPLPMLPRSLDNGSVYDRSSVGTTMKSPLFLASNPNYQYLLGNPNYHQYLALQIQLEQQQRLEQQRRIQYLSACLAAEIMESLASTKK